MRYYALRPPSKHKNKYVKANLVNEVVPLKENKVSEGNIDKMIFVRNVNVINWMINNSWISEDYADKANYQFSHYRKFHRYRAYQMKDSRSGENLGYVVFSVMEKRSLRFLKVLDYKLKSDDLIYNVLDLTLNECARWKIDVFEGPESLRTPVQKSFWMKKMCQSIKRGYYLHLTSENSNLNEYEKKLILNYCDSDIPYI